MSVCQICGANDSIPGRSRCLVCVGFYTKQARLVQRVALERDEARAEVERLRRVAVDARNLCDAIAHEDAEWVEAATASLESSLVSAGHPAAS